MDKIDAYDKEQLQGMDWLFDETQASDSGTLLVGEYVAVTPISKGQLVACQQNAKAAYVFDPGNSGFVFGQTVFAVAQSDAAENEPVDVMMYGGTFEATGVTGSGAELYAVCHMRQDVYTVSSALYFDHLTFDTPEPLPSYLKGTVAIALGNRQSTDGTGTTVTMYNQSKYFYVMNVFDETYLVDLANPVNVYWIEQVLGTSVEFGTAMGDNKGLQDTLSSSSDFGTKLAASVAFINALSSSSDFGTKLAASVAFINALSASSDFGAKMAASVAFIDALVNNSKFKVGLASKGDFGTRLGVNTGLAPVRTVKQALTNGQKQTAWGNIGLNVYIIDQSKFGTALTDAELAAYNAAEAILVTNHQKYVSALYLLSSNSGGNAMFCSVVNSSTLMCIRIDVTNTILHEAAVLWDPNAVRFNIDQSLSIAQSNRAIGNVGTGFYIVPYGGTVPAADLERAVGASALILTNTPKENMPKIYMRGGVAPNGNIYFYAFASSSDAASVNLNPTTGVVSNAAYTKITAGLLSYGSVQKLSIDETNRVMSNIGLDIMVVNLTNGSAALTQAQADALLASNGVIFTGSGAKAVQTERMKNRIFFRFENSFLAVYNRAYMMYADYTPDTRVITIRDIVGIADPISVHFTAQTLTEAQQAQARKNIGITQGLLNDADFIAELKTKLGLT